MTKSSWEASERLENEFQILIKGIILNPFVFANCTDSLCGLKVAVLEFVDFGIIYGRTYPGIYLAPLRPLQGTEE